MVRTAVVLTYAVLLAGVSAPSIGAAQQRPTAARLQQVLDSIQAASRAPGHTAAVVFEDGSVISLASGRADTARREPMPRDARMLAGSVGKTFFAALALNLVAEGRLDLDAPISRYLGTEPWFARLPNARDITVRQLMQHTSGLVRYEFEPAFERDLTADPLKVWQPEDQLRYIFDTKAPFPAGKGWEYSDTNYIVLAMILERVLGTTAYAEIDRRFLKPQGLGGTLPATSSRLPGLVQGNAGPGNPFGGVDAMITDGSFAINPQFEWAGGGFVSTSGDLARWARLWYTGVAVPSAQLAEAVKGVDAPMLGRGVTYGLGVIIRETPLGVAYGHAGFFPGYMTEMRYFVDGAFAVAVQVNTSAQGVARPGQVVMRLAEVVKNGT